MSRLDPTDNPERGSPRHPRGTRESSDTSGSRILGESGGRGTDTGHQARVTLTATSIQMPRFSRGERRTGYQQHMYRK